MKFKSGDQGNIFYKSSNPFELYDIFNGKNEKNSDEFLVEKKNPLVLPPDF